jgi:hypothetical protein
MTMFLTASENVQELVGSSSHPVIPPPAKKAEAHRAELFDRSGRFYNDQAGGRRSNIEAKRLWSVDSLTNTIHYAMQKSKGFGALARYQSRGVHTRTDIMRDAHVEPRSLACGEGHAP